MGSTRAPGATPVRPFGPPLAHDESGHRRAVRIEDARVARLRSRSNVPVPVHEVEALEDAAAQIGMGAVDACVEQRDRDPGSVEARQRHPRARRAPLAHVGPEGSGSRVHRADRVDAGDPRRALDLRERARREDR